jgi:hypothetical protein
MQANMFENLGKPQRSGSRQNRTLGGIPPQVQTQESLTNNGERHRLHLWDMSFIGHSRTTDDYASSILGSKKRPVLYLLLKNGNNRGRVNSHNSGVPCKWMSFRLLFAGGGEM